MFIFKIVTKRVSDKMFSQMIFYGKVPKMKIC